MIQDNTNASFTNAGEIANSQTANKLDTSVSDAIKQGVISQADLDEFKATGSISDAAKNKIKDYQAGVTGAANPTIESTNPPSYQDGINKAIEDNKQTEKELADLKAKELAAADAAKTEIVASEEQYAKDIQKTEEDNLKAQADLDAQEKARIAKNLEEEKKNLKAQQELDRQEKELEKQKLNAEAELLRQKNERALVEAEKNTYIERQRSAWAYNKIGLGFSSGVINQSQQIATNGIAKLAEIRAQMNYNERVTGIQQAQVMAQLNKIDLEYTNLINSAINQAAKDEADLDRNLRDRLTTFNRNMTMTLKDKNDRTQEAIRDWEASKNKIERQHIQDVQAIATRGLELSQMLQAETERVQDKEKEKITEEILTGNLLTLSDDELAKREQLAGLPRGAIKQRTNAAIQSGIRSIVDKTIGQDFIVKDMNKLNADIVALIKQGRSLPDAIEQVTNKYVKEQPEYKAQQALKAKESSYKSQMMDLDLEKSKLDIQGKKASIAASNASAAASRAATIAAMNDAQYKAQQDQVVAGIMSEYFVKTGETLTKDQATAIALRGQEFASNFVSQLSTRKLDKITPADSKMLDYLKDKKSTQDEFEKAFSSLSERYGKEQAVNMMAGVDNENITINGNGDLFFKKKQISKTSTKEAFKDVKIPEGFKTKEVELGQGTTRQ